MDIFNEDGSLNPDFREDDDNPNDGSDEAPEGPIDQEGIDRIFNVIMDVLSDSGVEVPEDMKLNIDFVPKESKPLDMMTIVRLRLGTVHLLNELIERYSATRINVMSMFLRAQENEEAYKLLNEHEIAQALEETFETLSALLMRLYELQDEIVGLCVLAQQNGGN
jgi:hypothetical protein